MGAIRDPFATVAQASLPALPAGYLQAATEPGRNLAAGISKIG